jgi:hypothetical protein
MAASKTPSKTASKTTNMAAASKTASRLGQLRPPTCPPG